MAHPHHGHGHDAGHHPEAATVHHETSDVSIRSIFSFAVGLFLVMVATYLVVWGFFVYLDGSVAREVSGRVYPLAAGQNERRPPEPRLQTNPRGDLGDLRTTDRDLLEHYSWVDRNAGVVRIPIDEAIRLTIERGLPSRPAAAAAAAAAAAPTAPAPQEPAR